MSAAAEFEAIVDRDIAESRAMSATSILRHVPTDLSASITLPEPVIEGLIPRGEVTLLGGHGGYSFVGSLADSNQVTDTSTPTKNDAVSIRGFNVGLDLAVDYFINSYFSVGVGALGDLLLLNRPAVDKPKGLTPDQQAKVNADPLYQKSGTSAGFGAGGMLRLGFHLGL